MKPLRVLIGYEFSGVVRDEFTKAGHDAMSCDLLPSDTPGQHYCGDVFDVIDAPWDLAIFHPPCTDLSVSGAKHFAAKKLDGRQQASVAMVMRTIRRSGHIPCVALENPVSILSSLWRKPDQIIQPWMFGHGETKATCLWLKNLPKLVPADVVEGREQRIWKMGPSQDRWRTPDSSGIARAMAEQWSNINP